VSERPEISTEPSNGASCGGVTDEKEERAAIMEHDGKIDRAEAERRAGL